MRHYIAFAGLITALFIILPASLSKTAEATAAPASATPTLNTTPAPASTPELTHADEASSGGTTSTTVVVPATAQWVHTGITLRAGDHLAISATGLWAPGSPQLGMVGPDGSSMPWPDNFFNLSDIGVCAYCATTATSSWAALMGYIGNAPPAPGSYTSGSVLPAATQVFLVGSQFESDRTLTGPLWLNFNDDAYSNGTGDNVGQVTATVTLTRSVVVGSQPALIFPFTVTVPSHSETWTIIQGFSTGSIGGTHTGQYQFAMDLQRIDDQNTKGEPVLAAASGVVIFTQSTTGCVGIRHNQFSDNGTPRWYFTIYCHLLTPFTVRAGQSVKQGDQIGQAWNTGTPSTCNPYPCPFHIHFALISATDKVANTGRRAEQPLNLPAVAFDARGNGPLPMNSWPWNGVGVNEYLTWTVARP